ncbi:hypothetical protein [Bradyrhizobium sp. CCBAU 051011]|uniref:hypothetical protein n=1 Tax=Bradyrhizobium sp. CCBAU 051011 TaxID=858422 RepID=UPI001379E1E2|nr:hypothetical protein [Bradyrhizobium sp. CCBAU 051011]
MGGLVYSGKFEEHINELYNPQNINKTAKKFKEYEKKNGPYSFGKFTKFLVPKKENWAGESDRPRGMTSGKSTLEQFQRQSATRLPKSLRPISDPPIRCRWC